MTEREINLKELLCEILTDYYLSEINYIDEFDMFEQFCIDNDTTDTEENMLKKLKFKIIAE